MRAGFTTIVRIRGPPVQRKERLLDSSILLERLGRTPQGVLPSGPES